MHSLSLLDYIFLSEDLVPYVDSVEIINDAINTSDHLPVKLSLSVNVAATCTKRKNVLSPTIVNWTKVTGVIKENYENVMERCLDAIHVPCINHDD